MSHHHEGVSCDSCLQNSFRGRRYKCLLCYDFDLCAACYEAGATRQHHTADHPMQCILPRADIELYYGGEISNSGQMRSYTCPYCCKMGFTYLTLESHVTKEHRDIPLEVICPICAATPGGDPNHMTEDLTRHLTLDHRPGLRNLPLLDDGIAIRVQDLRRSSHAQAVFRGRTRTVRRTNTQLRSGSAGSGQAASLRDPVDPIAELLSHLSGVRSTTSNTGRGAFHQFQMQLQIDQHMHVARQQLERLSQHQGRSLSSERKTLNVESSEVLASGLPMTPSAAASPQPNFLLPKALIKQSVSKADEDASLVRSQFVQELVISTMAGLKDSAQEDDRTNLELSLLKSGNADRAKLTPKDDSANDQAVAFKPEHEKAENKNNTGTDSTNDNINKMLE